MKFLIDAQLPRKVIGWFAAANCDAVHTLQLPDGNRTTDGQINDVARADDRVVITKDADFVNSHLVSGRPEKLLLVSTGNISNRELETLMVPLIPTIVAELNANSFVELGPAGVMVRG